MCGPTIRAILVLWCFVVQLTQRSAVLASIHASVGSGCKAMLAGSVAGSFPSLFVSSGKMCIVTPLSAQLHILLFHLVGAYFLLSNRILGIRYVFVFLLIFFDYFARCVLPKLTVFVQIRQANTTTSVVSVVPSSHCRRSSGEITRHSTLFHNIVP